ncbi:MAG: endonuclease III [Bacteroidota bacterium]
MNKTNWADALKPLLNQYKGKKHPLDYKNTYQLLVMVVLSAQDSDKHINALAPAFFKAFPNLKVLANSNAESLAPFIKSVRNFGNKGNWLMQIAQTLKLDKNIPLTMEGLTALPGIGRKSANVIMRESGVKAEGIIVDLHVVRVAPRLGIATGTDPKKIETQLMEAMPEKTWGDVGMAISFLGRETCRPKNPKHEDCVMNKNCEYCKANLHVMTATPVKPAKISKTLKSEKISLKEKPVKAKSIKGIKKPK